MTIDPEEPLTPDELAAFAALPRVDAVPNELAEQRTVQALHQHGLLAPSARRRDGRALPIGLGVAAAVALFAAGMVYGRSLARRSTTLASPSVEVQQAGTAYVRALMRLSQASDTERGPGLQAGAATLRAAATSLAQVDPGDPIAHRIRTSLDLATSIGADSHSVGSKSVVWF